MSSPSLCNQSQNDDFGWDSESHGKYTRADSSGNDQFLSVLLHQTVCITLTEPGRHDQPAGNGQATCPPCVCPARVKLTRSGTSGNRSGLCMSTSTGPASSIFAIVCSK